MDGGSFCLAPNTPEYSPSDFELPQSTFFQVPVWQERKLKLLTSQLGYHAGVFGAAALSPLVSVFEMKI